MPTKINNLRRNSIAKFSNLIAHLYTIIGKKLSTQLVPIPESVLQLKFRKSEAKYDLVFYATQLPALGYRSYYIKTVPTDNMAPVPEPTYTSSYTNIYNKVTIIGKH